MSYVGGVCLLNGIGHCVDTCRYNRLYKAGVINNEH